MTLQRDDLFKRDNSFKAAQVGGRGGGALPYKRLMGMCRWMGSHFHDWIDYNGVAFSIELLEWGRIFSDFGVRELFIFTVSKRTRIFVL